MTHIKVSANDSSLLFLELVAVILKALIPIFDSVVKSIKFLSRIRDIGGDEVEFLELNGNHSSFLRMLHLW